MKEILKFSAAWCGPCKMLAPIFDELKETYGNRVSFQSIDVDSDAENSIKYKVRAVPTVVFVKDGVEVSRVSGMRPKGMFDEMIKNFLEQ